MKKIITLSTFTFSFLFSFAQQIPNNDFENWTTQTLYENPNSFLTFNNASFTILPGGNVKKVSTPFHGSYAARLTTVANSTDTIVGALVIGNPVQGGIEGGLPYTGMPDSISVHVMYNVLANDTAFCIIGFKKNSVLVSAAIASFTGTQASYKTFHVPTGLVAAPDTIVAIITSSRLDGAQLPGSTLTIDSITCMGSAQQLPNADFENWTPMISEEPNNWSTINFAAAPSGPACVTKSTSSYTGTYAMRMETIMTTWNDSVGLITNGIFGSNGPEGGMQIYANPAKITGYYKYTPVGNDTALAVAICYVNGIKKDSSYMKLSAKSVYTYFELLLSYNSFPYEDTLQVSFASSDIDGKVNVRVGSVLYVDDLNVVYAPVGINANETQTEFSAYPNPFTNIALISFKNNVGSSYELVLYDMLGNVARKQNVSSSPITVNRNSLPVGIYEYRIIESTTSTIAGNGKLVIE